MMIEVGFPVHVSGALSTDWPMFALSAILTIVTGLLFGANVLMARWTAELGADTVAVGEQADEQHQQTLWPVVIVTRATLGRGLLHLRLKNIGNGPAVTIGVAIAMVNDRPVPTSQEVYINLGCALAASEAVPEALGVGLNALGIDGSDVTSFEFYVAYETIFGTEGRTRWKMSNKEHPSATPCNFDYERLENPQFARLRSGRRDFSWRRLFR